MRVLGGTGFRLKRFLKEAELGSVSPFPASVCMVKYRKRKRKKGEKKI